MSFLTRSSSSTVGATTQDTTISTVDNRVGGDNAVFGGNVTLNPQDSPIEKLSISTTDQGAVKAGLDTTLEALSFAKSTQAGSSSLAKDLTSQAFDLAQAARQSETSGAINNLVRAAVIVAVIGVLAYAFVHRRG